LWTDLKGYVFGTTFSTENPEELLQRAIGCSSDERGLVLDFFLGSGTTAATAHKMKRKWFGIEMAEHYNTEALPRMKGSWQATGRESQRRSTGVVVTFSNTIVWSNMKTRFAAPDTMTPICSTTRTKIRIISGELPLKDGHH